MPLRKSAFKGDNLAIISTQSQKGGVGKTTESINIAGELTRRKNRILFLDTDPQGSALDWAAARQGTPLFPIVGPPRATIHRDIATLGQGYDFVIIDGSPRVTDLARSAMLASDLVLIRYSPRPTTCGPRRRPSSS